MVGVMMGDDEAPHGAPRDASGKDALPQGAGNIVADPTRASAAENLTAQGFGTLRARPPVDQTVIAKGVYGTESYRVTFRRALTSKGRDAVALRPGSIVPVAFAVWNGSAGDRDGKKSVTIWQELEIGR